MQRSETSDAPDRAEAHPGLASRLEHRTVTIAAASFAAASGLFLAWHAVGALFLVLAALLMAALLDGCVRLLGRIWPGPRRLRLAVVVLVLVLGFSGLIAGGAYRIVQQADAVAERVHHEVRSLRGEIEERLPSADLPGGADGAQGGSLLRTLLPDPNALLDSVGTAFGAIWGGLGGLAVVVILGIYVAADPRLYLDGALLLLPRARRPRVRAVVAQAARTLRWWIAGQLVSMAVVATLSFVGLLLIGVDGALILATQAGLLGFVPYLGTLVGGAVIVLAALAQSGTAALWALGLYSIVQAVESYVVTPLVQERTVNLPPALLIGSIVLLGAVFGIWGMVLAAPIVAVARVFVLALWVERAGERDAADCAD